MNLKFQFETSPLRTHDLELHVIRPSMHMQVIHLLTAHESPELVMIPSSVRQLFSRLVICSISGQLGQHDPGIRTGVLQVNGGQT